MTRSVQFIGNNEELKWNNKNGQFKYKNGY